VTLLDRRAARRAEIDRDYRVVSAALVGALRRISQSATAIDADPEHLWQRVQGALEASREVFRRMNNMRINLRADRIPHHDDSMPLPDALTCYRHRGNYRGEFRSMAALGALLGRSREPTEGSTGSRAATELAEELHIRGELWTFEIGDSVHVFTTPRSPSDAALARLRPPLTAVRVTACDEPASPPP
jgi:hypothetical protein